MSKKKKECRLDDYIKTHDSVMNNIEGILSSLYGIDYLEYCDTPEYEAASKALYLFFYELSKTDEEKFC